MQRQSRIWAKLPQNLVVSVMLKLIADGDKAAAANLRRACKAWREASSQYPAALICTELAHIQKLCGTFPEAASLQLSIQSCTADDLQPLAACTKLTSLVCKHVLDMSEEATETFMPDVTYFPNSLQTLAVDNAMPYSRSQSLSNVTQLVYRTTMPSKGSVLASISLLQGLPSLQRITLDAADGPTIISSEEAQKRLANVTFMRLDSGVASFVRELPRKREVWRLAELEILNTRCKKAFIVSFFVRLPDLTSLTLDGTKVLEGNDSHAIPWYLLSTLRRLVLKDWPLHYLPENLELESLTWVANRPDGSCYASAIAKVAAMTKLTRLELASIRRFEDPKQLQSLPLLRVLILRECGHLGEQLLEPGAFDTLRELEITDDFPMTADGYPDLRLFSSQSRADIPPGMLNWVPVRYDVDNLDAMLSGMRERAVECMAAVMNLPNIEAVSGNASLFRMGLPEVPQGWSVSASYDHHRILTKI